jgi:endonuclease-3
MAKTTKKPVNKLRRATKTRAATSRLAKGISRGVRAGRGTDPARVKAILEKLNEAYPAATCALKHENAFQLLISTILSAQCTDERVNMVTPGLFKKYPNPQAFAYANPADIQKEIRSTGFYRNKTKSILGASKQIVEEFHGEVPRTMEELLTLPGVARKTANVVLGCAFEIASGVVVDTHVLRLSARLDLTKNTDPKKVELDLMEIIPQDHWILFSHQLIWHGRRICNARNPKCIECNLEMLCYSKDKTV